MQLNWFVRLNGVYTLTYFCVILFVKRNLASAKCCNNERTFAVAVLLNVLRHLKQNIYKNMYNFFFV